MTPKNGSNVEKDRLTQEDYHERKQGECPSIRIFVMCCEVNQLWHTNMQIANLEN